MLRICSLGTEREVDDRMKDVRAMSMATTLWIATFCSGQGLTAVVVDSSKNIAADHSSDRLRQFALQDGRTLMNSGTASLGKYIYSFKNQQKLP